MLELLILQSTGKLSLDDSPLKYIPELKISKDITLEMLASQISGLTRDSAAETFPLSDGPIGDEGPIELCAKGSPECTAQHFFEDLGNEVPLFAPETQTACTLPPEYCR